MTRPLLVTSALPYANGNIHLGHLVENIQSDIWVRFQRLTGRDVLYVCAADTHGTPIEVNARKLGKDPAVMVEEFRTNHERDFKAFGISFDTYDSTNSDENRVYAERVYRALQAGGLVYEKVIEQLFDEQEKRFLPDRFVKGTCPKCGTKDQYGDTCENCSAIYAPTDLVDPYSVLSMTRPVLRTSKHLFVKLTPLADELKQFAERLQPAVRNYVASWMSDGLMDWNISRDGPYFGFRIPDSDKYFYVWLDAPIGYISSASRLAKARGLDLAKYWPGTTDRPANQDDSEIVHFIGKDIIYFHTLFWPAMLKTAGFALPSKIHVHGMLNIGGAKMSKSRGRMITAREWIDSGLSPDYLRYYLAANLGPALDDIEFSLDELKNRVNSQLVNNVGNLANRVLKFVASKFEGRLGTIPAEFLEGPDYKQIQVFLENARAAFERLDYRTAIQQIEQIGFWANAYMQTGAAPFTTVKTNPAKAHADVTILANVIKSMATALLPVVPRFSEALFAQLGVAIPQWSTGIAFDLQDRPIGTPSPLLPPIETESLDQLFAPKTPEVKPVETPVAAEVKPPEPLAPMAPVITIDDFVKVDLRVGVIVAAEGIPKADTLKLKVDLGEPEPRTIAARIGKAYEPAEIVGRRVVVVANLAPRTMKIGKTELVSQGMVLAAAGGPKGLLLVDIPGDSAPGTKVK